MDAFVVPDCPGTRANRWPRRLAGNSTSFAFTDSAGMSSSARFYPAGSVRTGLVVYLDDNDHPLHDQDHDGDNPNLPEAWPAPAASWRPPPRGDSTSSRCTSPTAPISG